MSSLTIDHIIIVVSELELAAEQFKQLGFSIIPGGVHSGGLTHNSLVPFADGTYLELLATTRTTTFSFFKILKRLRLLNLFTTRQTAISRRLNEDIANGVGMVDFSMLSSDLSHDVAVVRKGGLIITDPIHGGRIRPDGQEISWRTAVPQTTDIPFLIDDITPRELRVPNVADQFHSNQIQGIYGISIIVSDLVESMAHYHTLLGEEPASEVKFPQPGTQTYHYNIEGKFISLSGPLPGTTALHQFLNHRPAKPLGIFFQTDDKSSDNLLSFTYSQDKGATLSSSRMLIQ
jgi:hypothetical protein